MNAVFGPIPSRRLGQTLGIDPLSFKTCNWNCVYCQLGRTSPFALERREDVPRAEILEQVEQVLEKYASGENDWITFVDSGETCLHSELACPARRRIYRKTWAPPGGCNPLSDGASVS